VVASFLVSGATPFQEVTMGAVFSIPPSYFRQLFSSMSASQIFLSYNLRVNAFSSNYLLTVSLSLGHYIPNFAAGEESPHVRRTSLFDYFKSHSQISFQSHLVHLRNRGLQVALIIVTVASLKSIKHGLKNVG
jgi:hypothetical protein